jgi:hypothetical protein
MTEGDKDRTAVKDAGKAQLGWRDTRVGRQLMLSRGPMLLFVPRPCKARRLCLNGCSGRR